MPAHHQAFRDPKIMQRAAGIGSYVDLIEAPRGSLPPVTFTWANDVLPYLG